MEITNTFVQIAPDSTATKAMVPPVRGETKPVHLWQYELLTTHPYHFTHEDLVYEVHIRHKGLEAEAAKRGAAIRKELLQKSHACLRASALPKKYGWGVHYDKEGRIALYGVDSKEYRQFVEKKKGDVKLVFAMRSKRD